MTPTNWLDTLYAYIKLQQGVDLWCYTYPFADDKSQSFMLLTDNGGPSVKTLRRVKESLDALIEEAKVV